MNTHVETKRQAWHGFLSHRIKYVYVQNACMVAQSYTQLSKRLWIVPPLRQGAMNRHIKTCLGVVVLYLFFLNFDKKHLLCHDDDTVNDYT